MASPGERESESVDTATDTSPVTTSTVRSSPTEQPLGTHTPSPHHYYYCTRLYTSPLDNSDLAYYVGLALITLASIATRLYRIDEPYHVA